MLLLTFSLDVHRLFVVSLPLPTTDSLRFFAQARRPQLATGAHHQLDRPLLRDLPGPDAVSGHPGFRPLPCCFKELWIIGHDRVVMINSCLDYYPSLSHPQPNLFS